MNSNQAQIALEFMKRVQLHGHEAPLFMDVWHALAEIADGSKLVIDKEVESNEDEQ